MGQTYTSAGTSINRNKLPRVFTRATFPPHRLVFDYGAGRYTDHIRDALPHVVYLPYDPYNLPEDVNRFSVTLVLNAMYARVPFPVDVVCSNVLNVIDSDDDVRKIARHVMEIVTRTGGTGYVTVYEGDRSGVGRRTGPDQWQRNAPLRDYLQYFPGASIRSGMIIVKGEKA